MVHQHYLAPGQPGGSRFNAMTRVWADAGHEVHVLAGDINYTTGQRLEGHARRVWTEHRDGAVRVLRCRVPGTYARGYLGRAWSFVGFLLTSVLGILRVPRPDIVVATSPPLTICLTGWLAARLGRCPFVFEVRDLWPESAVTTGVLSARGRFTSLLYSLERWACRSAMHIVVLTPAFAKDIERRGLAPAEKMTLIPNGADIELFSGPTNREAARDRLGWADRFVFLYAGAHGRANALTQILETAALMKDEPRALFAFAGDGTERLSLAAAAKARGLENVVFLGPVPKAEMPELLAAADVGVAVLQRNETFRTVYPNKAFDYMTSGRPVLLGIDGVARELVCEEARAGVFGEPESPSSLAAAARLLLNDPALASAMGNNGRVWVNSHASRPALARRYLDLLARLVKHK